MIINSVKLHNIRSYLDEEIVFPKGAVLLSGDIGSGKSSILLAIEFALFGIMPGNLEGEALLRNGKNNGYAELHFSVDEKNVTIRRNLKRINRSVRQDSGYLIIDNFKLDLTPSELKARVLEILGYPKELLTKSKALIYRYTVYTHQEAMKHILFEDSETRLDVFRRIFQIDKYRRISSNCSLILQSINEKRKVISSQISDLEERKLRKMELETKLKEINVNIAGVIPAAKDYENKIEEKQNSISLIEGKIRELSELKARAGSMQARIEEKQKQLTLNNSELKKLEAELIILEKKTEATKSQLPVFLARTAAMQSFISRIENEARRKKGIMEEIAYLEDELNKLKGVIKENEITLTNAEAIIKQVSKLNNCPLCLQPVLENHKTAIHEAENRKITEAKNILLEKIPIKIEQEEKIRNWKLEIDRLNEKEKIAERLKSYLSSFKATLEEINLENEMAKYIDMEKEIKFEEKEIPILINLQQQIKQSSNLAELINDKKNLKNSLKEKQEVIREGLKELEQQINIVLERTRQFENTESIYQKAKLELNELMNKIMVITAKKAVLEKEEEYITKNILEIEQEISRKIKLKEELSSIIQLQNWLQEYFINLMSLMEKQVMLKVHQEFEELFKSWFSILMEGEILNARLDENFSPIVMQDGYEISVENLSGGEKTSCALAYRLALNKVINDMMSGIKTKDLIILDEPTDGFSSEQLEKVRDVIKQLNMQQVIIVSHEAKVESFVDNVIRIVKSEHVSRVEA